MFIVIHCNVVFFQFVPIKKNSSKCYEKNAMYDYNFNSHLVFFEILSMLLINFDKNQKPAELCAL